MLDARLLGRLLLVGIPWFAGCSSQAAGEPSSLRAELDRDLEEAHTDGWSGAALITVHGEVVTGRGLGLADRERQTASSIETAFDVGSIMKDFTAAAIFRLQAEGRLSVTDSLAELLMDVPADKADIQLIEILQHRAGFQEFHDTEGDFQPMTRLEAREHILQQTLLFPPGEDEAYSNSGFTLLADIVQERSEVPFAQYVREKLFEPARMKSTGFYGDGLWGRVETAIGYDAESFEDNDPATWPLTWALVGNGGLVTTVADLDRWLVASRDGTALDSETLEAYDTSYLSSAATDVDGHTVYGYAGAGDYGLGGVVLDCPAQDTRVILTTNTAERFDVEDLAVDLMLRVLREP